MNSALQAWPAVGQVITETRRFSQADFDRFAALSGDDNPIHVDAAFAATTSFGRPVAHGMLLYSAMCATLNRHFPGAIQTEQSLKFPAPTYADETMTIQVVVDDGAGNGLQASLRITDPAGAITCEGNTILHRSAP